MKKTIEITRSYSQKVKIGDYLTADFFMSAKAEVAESEMAEKSKELNELCQKEVQESIEEYLDKMKVKKEPIKLKPKDFAKAKAEASDNQAIQEIAEAAGGEQRLEEDKVREANRLEEISFEQEVAEELKR